MIRARRELLPRAEWVRRLVRCQLWRQQRLQRSEVLLHSLDAQALPGLSPTHTLHPRDLLAAALLPGQMVAQLTANPTHSVNPLQRFHWH